MYTYNPKKKGHYKAACHRLMDEIFGSDKAGVSEAYVWLKRNFNKQVHFSQINDEKELKIIWEKLYALSFKKHDIENTF